MTNDELIRSILVSKIMDAFRNEKAPYVTADGHARQRLAEIAADAVMRFTYPVRSDTGSGES